MKKFFLILIVLIFIQFSHTYSQNCPQGTGTWNFTNINYTDFYGNNGQVDYKYRTTAPFQIQLVIDWSTLVTDSYFLSDSTMMKLLTVAILRDIPTASTPYNYQIDLYFEKECKAKLKAVIQVDQALDICCSEGGSYAEHLYEKFAGGQNRHFVNVYQEVSCGTKCCLRRYFVYRGAPQSQIQISGPTSYSVNNCNPTSSYFDCIDNTPIPCVDGNCAEY